MHLTVPQRGTLTRLPAKGLITFGLYHRVAEGDAYVLVTTVSQVLVDGQATLQLSPTDGTNAWLVDERVPDGRRRAVTVPDTTAAVEYNTLTEVTLASLTPVAEAVPAWTAAAVSASQARDQAYAARDAAIAAAGSAGGSLQKTANLSDLASPSTARTNLGLGDAATHPAADFATPASVAATYLPLWKPNTAYLAVAVVVNPSGQIVRRKADGTSGATYDSTAWDIVAGGAGGGAVSSVASRTGDVVLTKTDVGLGAVSNTADADKPVSTAAQAALDGKVPTGRKVAGKALTADVTLVKADVGLGNVDNTPDSAKPVSTAQAAAIATAAAFTAATSDQVRALATYPLGSGLTVTVQASNSSFGSAASTITGTLLTPLWTANTYYPAGATVLDPTNPQWSLNTIVRTTTGVSGASYDATEQAKWTTRTGGGPTGYPIRYNAARLRSSEGNGQPMFLPLDGHYVNGGETAQYALRPQQWSLDLDWYTAAGALEVPVFGSTQLRFVVDGKYASATPSIRTNTQDFNWKNIKLSGVSAGYHRVRVEIGGAQPMIAGVRIANGDQAFFPTLPQTKSFVIIGDSFAEGAAALDSSSAPITGDLGGYGAQLAKLLGISNYYSLAISGSGFTQPTNAIYQARIQDLAALAPDYCLIQSSVNDYGQRNTTLSSSLSAFLTALQAANLTNTKIVLSGIPYYANTPAQSQTISDIERPIVQDAGVQWLETATWAYGPTAFASSDNLHPTLAGHEYIARRYAAALGPLWGLPT